MSREPSFPDLLIIGASTRAAAHSALRGGLRPICIDLFGDADLRSVAEVVVVADYPAGLPAVAEAMPICPWMYTGGLENHARIVDRLARMRPLLGNGRDVLGRIRDPWWLEAGLRASGLPALEVWRAGDSTPPRGGRWLRKPLRGAGGRGIQVWNSASAPPGEPYYFQRRAEGESYSALFMATVEASTKTTAKLLGITLQLVGLAEVSAPPFAWCGSVTPVALPPNVASQMERIGRHLADAAGLRGLFGCDFVVNGDVPFLTEVNPRYTSAMELLDRQRQMSLVASHLAACADERPLPLAGSDSERRGRAPPDPAGGPTDQNPPGELAAPRRVLAKLVLFAGFDVVAGDTTSLMVDPRESEWPAVADLPPAGQFISAGQPICTVFAEEDSEPACRARLRERACQFHAGFLQAAKRR